MPSAVGWTSATPVQPSQQWAEVERRELQPVQSRARRDQRLAERPEREPVARRDHRRAAEDDPAEAQLRRLLEPRHARDVRHVVGAHDGREAEPRRRERGAGERRRLDGGAPVAAERPRRQAPSGDGGEGGGTGEPETRTHDRGRQPEDAPGESQQSGDGRREQQRVRQAQERGARRAGVEQQRECEPGRAEEQQSQHGPQTGCRSQRALPRQQPRGGPRRDDRDSRRARTHRGGALTSSRPPRGSRTARTAAPRRAA